MLSRIDVVLLAELRHCFFRRAFQCSLLLLVKLCIRCCAIAALEMGLIRRHTIPNYRDGLAMGGSVALLGRYLRSFGPFTGRCIRAK